MSFIALRSRIEDDTCGRLPKKDAVILWSFYHAVLGIVLVKIAPTFKPNWP
jgi:hypothetical protein